MSDPKTDNTGVFIAIGCAALSLITILILFIGAGAVVLYSLQQSPDAPFGSSPETPVAEGDANTPVEVDEYTRERWAGTYAGTWTDSNANYSYERTFIIDPSLLSGMDYVQASDQVSLELPMTGSMYREEGRLKWRCRNHPKATDPWSPDNMICTLSDDGTTITITLVDDNGLVGSGQLYKVSPLPKPKK